MDPWTFGWTQLLAIAGLLLTLSIAVAGFRTFGRWKREKIEEKRIDAAIEAMAYAYEAKWIFKRIRSALSYDGEWAEMPKRLGSEGTPLRARRGPFFAVLKRIEAHNEYFARGWALTPRCKALFGSRAEDLLLSVQQVARTIQVSAEMLMEDDPGIYGNEEDRIFWNGLRAEVWEAKARNQPDGDKIGRQIDEFEKGMEALCRPIIDRGYNAYAWTWSWHTGLCKSPVRQ